MGVEHECGQRDHEPSQGGAHQGQEVEQEHHHGEHGNKGRAHELETDDHHQGGQEADQQVADHVAGHRVLDLPAHASDSFAARRRDDELCRPVGQDGTLEQQEHGSHQGGGDDG